jgi:hypothetical protein
MLRRLWKIGTLENSNNFCIHNKKGWVNKWNTEHDRIEILGEHLIPDGFYK